ncbi:response regulator receiver citrate/malate [Alkalihalophilus pseudofirmus OF4]|uniref:Response regulator receiver citrate/malate n=2 Tax=Alkalihalophilus pseudofirmus TaxID=79885 RepID=D3FWQ0_ALKPO|nr:response regulator [Alkalihalophilus pseudofirmus]ADC50548.1 response regulator receiver citrate/malate [Alkalihalophilus pseudofirmus OF4]MDV2883697.1 response regulator [Alkalihalophilus pseudofirmus]
MKIKTLIVEDDPMVASINQGYLEKLDSFFVVDIVTNGEEALSKIRMKKIELLLLDVYMAKMNGLELLRRIRKENEKIDVIMITAADSPEIIEEIFRLGVVDCILKPFDFKRFERSLLTYYKRYNMFNTKEPMNQSIIDSININEENKKLTFNPLPKGIDSITLNTIRKVLKEAPCPLTIQELEKHVQISKITIRKYLEFLALNNEIKLDLNYSTKGRPSKLYSYKLK